jgi:outer membrane lipoprotein carrier protein
MSNLCRRSRKIENTICFSKEGASPEDPTTVQELIDAVEGTYKDVKSLKADFVQTVSSPVAGELKQKGRVQVESPRKARWDVLGDQPSSFITNGERIWLYTPAMKQVMVMQDLSTTGGGNVDLLALLDDMSKLDEQFTVTMSEGGGGKQAYRVKLQPKADRSQYQEVELVFARKKFTLEEVVLKNAMGDTIRMDFSGVKLNADIPDASFEFAIPEGVTVIEG